MANLSSNRVWDAHDDGAHRENGSGDCLRQEIAFSVLILLSPSFCKVYISTVPAGLTIITP